MAGAETIMSSATAGEVPPEQVEAQARAQHLLPSRASSSGSGSGSSDDEFGDAAMERAFRALERNGSSGAS